MCIELYASLGVELPWLIKCVCSDFASILLLEKIRCDNKEGIGQNGLPGPFRLIWRESHIDLVIAAGADVCYDSKLPLPTLVLLLSAQLRRYIEYDHFHESEAVPFQVGDIIIDSARRLVWVRREQVKLRPREFNLLLYFMQNPDVVLTAEQICENAWGAVGNYNHGISHPIYLLRKAIEPDPTNPIYIKTMKRVGYYFAAHYDEI